MSASFQPAVWWQAARPRTLGAAVAPVLMGSTMARADGGFHAPAALATLAFTVLLQVGTNYWNDYADFVKGVDTPERLGPRRAVQAGLVAPRTMRRAAAAVFALAVLAGVYLCARAGWPFLLLVAAAVASGVFYTAGPRPLGYLGLGDLLVLVFFGPVAVAGTHLAQTLHFSAEAAAAGFGPGLWSVAILAVNNLRDADPDARAGKRTLAVRFGKRFARAEYAVCVAAASLIPAALVLATGRHPLALLTLLALPAAAPAVHRVFTAADPRDLNPLLGATGRLLLLYSLLFAAGWILS